MVKGKVPAIVRQFLYLDTEQVRSFVAQIERGLPEKKERSSLKRHSGGGKGSVRIPAIAEMGITGNTLWESSSTETMSMHHFLFSIFEEAIQKSKKVVKIASTSKLNTCLDKLREGSVFIFVKGTVQIGAVEPPFIEPVSELISWLMKQQRKLVKEGVSLEEIGIVPYMDKIPRNLAGKLKTLIPVESFVMNITAEKLPLQFHGTLYSKNFQSEDSPDVLLTPSEQAASAIIVVGITNTIPLAQEGHITTVGITPLAIYREY